MKIGPIDMPAAERVYRLPSVDAWALARRRFLGASTAAKILGCSPYGGPWSVWAACNRPELLQEDGAAQKARGHREEPRIFEDYRSETGHHVAGPLQTVIIQSEAPFGVSPDGLVRDGEWGLLEAKTDASNARWGRSGEEVARYSPEAIQVVREDYLCQCYTLLAATGLPFCRIVVRRSLDDLRWITVHADPGFQRALMERLREWWRLHIEEGQEPQVDDSEVCRAFFVRTFPERAGLLPAPEAISALVARKAAADAALAAAEAEKKLVENLLLQSAGPAAGWEGPWGKARLQKAGGGTRFDSAAFKAAYPELYQQFQKPVESGISIRLYLKE